MKDDLVENIANKRQKFHALECSTGCTSCICNNWTAGVTAGVACKHTKKNNKSHLLMRLHEEHMDDVSPIHSAHT